MRYGKVVETNGVESARYDYVYSDGTLILLTYTANEVSQTARFVYDSWGEPRGFMLNDSATYLYLKNAQGDITGIVDEKGAVLLTYSYTAWGEVTYSATNMQSLALAVTLSKVNPFTYRGYCYDYDIGMYYLQSRYYDPEICRFINADSTEYLGATGTLLSYNLFTYCENDGVNFIDETGTWGKDVQAGYYNKNQKKKLFDEYPVTTKINSEYSNLYIPYYDDDIYYGTYFWCLECGINEKNAKIIAYHCNDVDSVYSPVLYNYQSWHFNTNGKGEVDSRLVNSLLMSFNAAACFEAALSYKKGTKKYKTLVKDGLMYLGYALHPLQDMYAHTPDKCYPSPVPYEYYYLDPYGQKQYGTYFKIGWSHVRAFDKTDKVKARPKQLEKTREHTKEILELFMRDYKTILIRNNGVKI